jgi:hypothetical protein
MRASLQAAMRQSVMFWTIAPLLVTLVLIAFVEISGRFFSQGLSHSAAGIMFLAAFVPPIAAHLSFLSAVIGLILLLFGLTAERRLMMSILLGLAFGTFMLHRIYLG